MTRGARNRDFRGGSISDFFNNIGSIAGFRGATFETSWRLSKPLDFRPKIAVANILPYARPRSRSPGLRSRSVHTCQGLRPGRAGPALRWRAPPFCLPLMTTASASQLILSRLNGWPICTPADASPPASQPTAHGSPPCDEAHSQRVFAMSTSIFMCFEN
jgi:hypothetical protein